MKNVVRRQVILIFTTAIFASMVSLLFPIVTSTGPTAGDVWIVKTGDSYPISITTNVETAGNGTKSIRQTGTLRVVTTDGTAGDFTGCVGCSGTCLILNRSALVPEWDKIWFALYDDYNALDEENFEITCLCPANNSIPAKVMNTSNWQDMKNLLQAKSDALQAEAIALGATDYVGTVTGTDPSYELSYSYSNGTSDTGVKRNGKITYKNGILTKMVFNEEQKGDSSGLPVNTVIIRSEKWTMGEQGVSIPSFPIGAILIASIAGIILIIRKTSLRAVSFKN